VFSELQRFPIAAASIRKAAIREWRFGMRAEAWRPEHRQDCGCHNSPAASGAMIAALIWVSLSALLVDFAPHIG
jgi:hypothetical protein